MSHFNASSDGGRAAAATNRAFRLSVVVAVRRNTRAIQEPYRIGPGQIAWRDTGRTRAVTELIGECGHVVETLSGDQERSARFMYLDLPKPRRKRCPECPR